MTARQSMVYGAMLGMGIAAALILVGCGHKSSSGGGGPDPLVVTTQSLPDATVGTPYSFTLTATGGIQPYSWSLASGSLPTGLTLSTAGEISGTPTVAGSFPITVQVTDSQSTPETATAPLMLTVLTTGGRPDVTLCIISGTQRGLVDLCYQLTDAESDLVTILVEVSTDSGVSFSLATSGPGGEGTGPIQGSPIATGHLFVWDSMTDLGLQLVDPVRLRLTPSDAAPGIARETGDFIIENRPGASQFILSKPMQVARMYHTATLLPSGEVLVAGGLGAGNTVLDSAEIFSPVTGEFTLLPNTMTTPRTRHTATLLPNDTVLIAGGMPAQAGPELDSAEIFDPSAGTFQATGLMADARRFHATTVLGGVAYVTGGYDISGPTIYNRMEEFDPAGGGTFSTVTGTFQEARAGHGAHALSNGRILLISGSELQSNMSAEEFDPVTGTSPVSEVTAMIGEMVDHATSLLQDGTVLITGGGTSWSWSSIWNSYDQALIWTPGVGFTDVGPLIENRRYHTSTQVPDGRVLLAGGEANLTFLIMPDSEVYDPVAQSFTLTDIMTMGRVHHAAVLLTDGRVLITGGMTVAPDPVSETERFHP